MKNTLIAVGVMMLGTVSWSTATAAGKSEEVVVKPVQVTNPFQVPATVNGLPATFTITNFVRQNGQLVAQGTITGVSQAVSAPAQILSSTCNILTLNIGAIHLDLLGLVVDVAPIDINISAVAAPGNLLGNLLCAITNLLNNPSGSLAGVVALLNRILGIFG